MSWTKNGTVSVTNSSAIVYGASTTWASGALTRPGDIFKAPDGRDYEVLSVQSNTQLTLVSPYLGTTASAQAYSLIHTGLLPAELAVGVSEMTAKNVGAMSQLYDWETSTAATVPLTNPATQVTTQVKPIAGLIADVASKAPAANPTFSGNVGVGVSPAVSVNRMSVLGTGAFSPVADNSNNGVGVCVLGQDLATAGPASARFFMTGQDAAHAGCMELRSGSVNTSHAIFYNTTGAVGLDIDATGAVLSRGGGLIGYGSGGTVTQATSKTTPVTLNKPTGTVYMNNSALPAGGIATFVVNNFLVTSVDNVVITQGWATESYRMQVQDVFNGYFRVQIENRNSVSLSEGVRFNFTVFKGAAA